MARLVVMSSWVAAGHVGLAAAGPVLTALGHEMIALPTVMLSNHRAWPAVAGTEVAPEDALAMLDAVAANGWLAGIGTIITGYLPTAGHADAACRAVERVRAASPEARVVCDPVLGDAPKGLYVAKAAAAAIRDRLVPMADVLTPNLFELGWLTRQPVKTLAEAAAAARALGGRRVLVTSPPLGADETGVLEVTANAARLYRVPRLGRVPHGTGDVFAALIGAGLSPGAALGHLQALIGASAGAPHLAIARRDAWAHATPVPAETL